MRWLGPWSASSGAHSSASASPVTSTKAAASATADPPLFRNDVLKARPGKYRENGVVQRQERQEPRRIVAHSGPDAADEDRQRERQEEEREEQLARPAGRGHRRE